ncbi:unnamed protein product [Rotaria sp. Silwood2]|nr:unnamed protein product [Rotaria sp. Silwood2]CAF4308750.1 unnamed protein product [Rotaria sp. Silwood2]
MLDLIDELSRDKNFLKDYAEWSFKLFSQPDYIYGRSPSEFPCPIPKTKRNNNPKTVHELRPSDIQCVAALGDSLTAGLGAHAVTPAGLFTENRGASWSIGGDYTFSTVLTLPNILREYNSQLKGYSTKTSVIFLKGQNSSHNQLNVAKSGDRSYHMIDQAHILLDRLKSGKYCDLKNDWKIITFFIGGNDLCIFCDDLNKHSPKNFTKYVTETLDYLHANIPRAFVNLVLVLDVRGVELLNAGGPVCKLLHKKTCPCAAFPTEDQATTLSEWIQSYHNMSINLVNSGCYDTRDDFTVVVQPFMAKTALPRLIGGDIDFTYFAPDCFHFSGKGHARAALSLWNNMLEPVGEKQWSWHEGENLKCPTEQNPYFFTSVNSPKHFESIPK